MVLHREYDDSLMRIGSPYPQLDSPMRRAIDGEVETDDQKREREARAEANRRQARVTQIKQDKKSLDDAIKSKLRALDKNRRTRTLARWALILAVLLAPGLVGAWIVTIMWGAATNFTDGRGGPLAFYMVGLLVLSIMDGLGVAAALTESVRLHEAVIHSTDEHHDALNNRTEYESALSREDLELLADDVREREWC